MKKKSKNIEVGQAILIGGREAEVVSVDKRTVDMVVPSESVVMSYRIVNDSEKDAGALYTMHVKGDDKVEVVPPSAFDKFVDGVKSVWKKIAA